ncbi:hypothetical protein AJ80_01848 [Polytolypa hystricis UAMH7299]|uniref:Orotidine 5'-phosphate decarboxylase domain-containing protein n=1 Tax=Polytolypa hystricis (strain UAMH7299) TaxID=1447883 RepID=A0A2B7YR93_POLH7|nr:hypothetical protein AJ80_01848 [Polytolypa hystricis UAMH7299]
MDRSTSSSTSVNLLTGYLRTLQRCKSTLPHGALVCVSASPSISTMAGLLRLAYAVGPLIAVLQVHADIIDDWSMKAAQKLSLVAKKFGFLIWEGGRVLNAQRRSLGDQSMSNEEIKREIEMARKRYTKGVVSVAAWAGLVSTWIICPEEQGKGGERLIPTLRRAARETLASMNRFVSTEIQGGGQPEDSKGNSFASGHDLSNSESGDLGVDLSPSYSTRKTSVISLTRTITQHSEPSNPSSPCEEAILDDEEDQGEQGLSSCPPPVLGRGLLLNLPAMSDSKVPSRYRDASITTARAHCDFVVGFVTDQPWTEVVRRGKDFIDWEGSEDIERDSDDDDEHECCSGQTFAIFAPLESQHVGAKIDTQAIYQTPLSPRQQSAPSIYQHQINSLHQLIAQAMQFQRASLAAGASGDSNDPGDNDPEILYIPIISMNA